MIDVEEYLKVLKRNEEAIKKELSYFVRKQNDLEFYRLLDSIGRVEIWRNKT